MGNPVHHRLGSAEEASGMLAACTLDGAINSLDRRERVLARRIARLREPRSRPQELAPELRADPSQLLAPLAEFEERLRAIMSLYATPESGLSNEARMELDDEDSEVTRRMFGPPRESARNYGAQEVPTNRRIARARPSRFTTAWSQSKLHNHNALHEL
jgi:hypothetical protein